MFKRLRGRTGEVRMSLQVQFPLPHPRQAQAGEVRSAHFENGIPPQGEGMQVLRARPEARWQREPRGDHLGVKMTSRKRACWAGPRQRRQTDQGEGGASTGFWAEVFEDEGENFVR